MSGKPRARRAFIFGFLALAVALLIVAVARAIPNNQALSRADIFAGIGTTYSWSGSAQPWSTDHRLVSRTEFTTFVQNSGACPGTGAQIMTQSAASGCAVVANTHTPILANNTFAAGSITSWSASFAYAGCASGGTAAAINAADEDSDSGFAEQGSGIGCVNGNTAIVALSQTFSIAGNPANQSYAVWYRWNPVVAGDGVNCDQQSGAVNNLQVTINGHTQTTVPNPVGDNAWHKLTATTTDLLTGSNTFSVSASISGARGHSVNGGTGLCTVLNSSTQPFDIDNAVLTATW